MRNSGFHPQYHKGSKMWEERDKEMREEGKGRKENRRREEGEGKKEAN